MENIVTNLVEERPSPAIEVSEWAEDNAGKFDASLIGAFVYTMKARGMGAATPDAYFAAFTLFKDEVA